MKNLGYLVFHLNLAFSSVDENEREKVIQNCYDPLLDTIEGNNLPVGIELSGWTLMQIEQINPSWIRRFRKLLESGICELVGSGYCQIIGPLVPHKVNQWNQKLGLDVYQKILHRRPNIALVNEMAFSQSLIDLYDDFDYQGIIIDRDNIKLAINSDVMPTHTTGNNDTVLPILWSDSIMFQKLQHYVHGDISMNDYLSYFKDCLSNNDSVLPIYCNDAEIFDYRPGRFSEERPTHHEGEWNRIRKALNKIRDELCIDIVLPSDALKVSIEHKNNVVSKIVSAAYPIPVKKQSKYNIARWAVTGRDDSWINTMCYRIYKCLTESNNNEPKYWIELCELWASDFRTHITEQRWIQAKKQINNILSTLKIKESFFNGDISNEVYDELDTVLGSHANGSISLINDGIILQIKTKKLKIDLNLRRGLALHQLAFLSHEFQPCIGTLSHGFFESISLGADFYSGNTIIELPLLRKRITDLEAVTPKFLMQDNKIKILTSISTPCGTILKEICIYEDSETISINYNFSEFNEVYASARLGIITLMNDFCNDKTQLMCTNGGMYDEVFDFCGDFDHSKPGSTLVSSSRGLGATSGKIVLANNNKNIILSWDPSECAVIPMLCNLKKKSKTLSRIYFSMNEYDDTFKQAISLRKNFSLRISS